MRRTTPKAAIRICAMIAAATAAFTLAGPAPVQADPNTPPSATTTPPTPQKDNTPWG